MTTPDSTGSRPVQPAGTSVPASSTGVPEPGQDASAEEIEADIEHTRQELGDTVEALAEKLDVKAQTRQQVDEVKERAADQIDDVRRQARGYVTRAKYTVIDEEGKPQAWVGLAVTAAAVIGAGAIFLRRRNR